MRIVALQHDIVWENKAATHAVVDQLLSSVPAASDSLIVTAELFDTGFSMNLDAIADDPDHATIAWASRTARARGSAVLAGHARRGGDGLGRNCFGAVAPDGS